MSYELGEPNLFKILSNKNALINLVQSPLQ